MNNMKARLTVIGLFLCLFSGLFAFSSERAFAFSWKGSLFSQDPIILPTSPIYFIKQWRRSFVRALTRDPVSQIVLELDILDEKASELRKIREVKSDDFSAIKDALREYGDAQRNLQSRLESISSLRTERERETVIKELFSRLAFHAKLFAEISDAYSEEPRVADELKSATDGIAGTTAKVSEATPENSLKDLWLGAFASGTLATSTEIMEELEFMQKVKGFAPDRLKKYFEDLELQLTASSTNPLATSTTNSVFSTSTSTSTIQIACIALYDPVCGSDGKTYGNSCLAESVGILQFIKGECEE